MEKEVLWFLAEVAMISDKFHIVHPICRMEDILDGIDYIWRHPIILEEERRIAIIRDTGEMWLYRKDKITGKPVDGFLDLDLEKDYDNIEVLFPLLDDPLDDPIEYRYGKIHHSYE